MDALAWSIGGNTLKSMRFRVKNCNSVDKRKQNDDGSVSENILLCVVSDENGQFSTHLCFCGLN